MAISPTTEGFRAAFRRPSLTLAEISWRWVVGATGAALVVFGLVEYLDTLPVTNGELLFFRSRQPYLVAEAIAHILRGSMNRAVIAGILAAFLLASFWIIAASVGRIATVRGLLEYFRRDIPGRPVGSTANNCERDVANDLSIQEHPLRALAGLNFLRVAAALAAILGLIGASILAGFASPGANPRPGAAFFLFLTLAALVFYVWSALNWLLSLSGIFAVRDGDDAIAAIAAAVTLCRKRGRAVSAVGAWTGLAHLVAFVGATAAISMPLGLLALVSWRLAIAITLLGTLAYFALADWFYMARMAGYMCIIEMPAMSSAPLPPWPANSTGAVIVPALQITLDRDETILSDVPILIPAAPAAIDAKRISELVELELSRIDDPKLLSRIRELMVVPYAVERAWDYGAPGEHFACWTVLEHRASNTGIAFCERGFGPKNPWGLVSLSGPYMSIGMDSGWFASLEGAMRDSMAWDEPNPEGYGGQ